MEPVTKEKPMIPARMLFLVLVLIAAIIFGIYNAWAQCMPGDLICMNWD